MAAGGDEARWDPGEAADTLALQRKQWVTGMRLFAAVGLVFAGLYVVMADGPWRWLSGAIAVVCLVRGTWYAVKAREMGRMMAARGGEGGQR